MSDQSSEDFLPRPEDLQGWRAGVFAEQAAALREAIKVALLTPRSEYNVRISEFPRAAVDQVMEELRERGWKAQYGDQRNADYIFFWPPRSRR